MSEAPRKTFGHCLSATLEQWRDEAARENGYALLRDILASAATNAGYDPPQDFAFFLHVRPGGEGLSRRVPTDTPLEELATLTGDQPFTLCGEGASVRRSGEDEVRRLRAVAQAAADFAWLVGPGDDPDMADTHARLWSRLLRLTSEVEIHPDWEALKPQGEDVPD